MTVGELIRQLEGYPQDEEVLLAISANELHMAHVANVNQIVYYYADSPDDRQPAVALWMPPKSDLQLSERRWFRCPTTKSAASRRDTR